MLVNCCSDLGQKEQPPVLTGRALVHLVLDFASFLEDFRGLLACRSEVRFSL